jgi:UDP-N-acetylglucosamine/UDP-N-acetylgalactosamine diphosphorylase
MRSIENSLRERLAELGQKQLEKQTLLWNGPQQKSVLQELTSFHPDLLKKQKELLLQHPLQPSLDFTPLQSYHREEEIPDEFVKIAGKTAVLLVAGGEGTRLGSKGPKGCFPISPARHKSLFQLFSEKIVAASTLAGQPIPLAIMTSQENDQATRDYFIASQFFGMAPSQVTFFSQGSLPFLNPRGELFFQAPGKLAKGPNGNGACFKALKESGLLASWKQQGIEWVMFLQVDNPLADPFDLKMIGLAEKTKSDVVIKAVEKASPEEKVGVIAQRGKKIEVVEYSEIPSSLHEYPLANISLFCFSLKFMEKVSHLDLPLHKAFKPSSWIDEKGKQHHSSQPNSWKFEWFVFDCLPFADRVEVILAPRETCFSPLKSKTGPFSEDFVKEALIKRERQVLEKIAGFSPPPEVLEIDPRFFYPTEEVRKYWKGRQPPALPYVGAVQQ